MSLEVVDGTQLSLGPLTLEGEGIMADIGTPTPIPEQAFRMVIGSTDPKNTTHFVYEPWYGEDISEVAERAALADIASLKNGHQLPNKENAWHLIEVVKISDLVHS